MNNYGNNNRMNNNPIGNNFINNNSRNDNSKNDNSRNDNSKNDNSKNDNFVNNKETFNQRIFDRNLLSAQISSVQNKTPTYFSENYKTNRNDSEKIFEKRFENNIYNFHSHPRAGIVDFSEPKKNDKKVDFKKNYGDYI